MKVFYVCIATLLLSSCIPLRNAPNIEEDQVIKGRKFKSGLTKDQMFVFEDNKDADEFYHYVNTKYDLNHQNVETDVPIKIKDNYYYFSFYEVEKTSETLNLIPLAIDASRENNGRRPLMENSYVSRKGKWYIAMTVTDDMMSDCLNSEHKNYEDVLEYCKSMRKEYHSNIDYDTAHLRHKLHQAKD